MSKTKRIQEECLIAFIHSRMIGLGAKDLDIDIKPLFTDKKAIEKAEYIKGYYLKKLEKIATFDTIQAKISTLRYDDAELYFRSYSKLGIIMDKYAPVGSEIVEGLIGLGILMAYYEYWNHNNKLKLEFDRFTSAIDFYTGKNKEISRSMIKIAENIYRDYAKISGEKYE